MSCSFDIIILDHLNISERVRGHTVQFPHENVSFAQKTKISPVMPQNVGDVNKTNTRISGVASRRMA